MNILASLFMTLILAGTWRQGHVAESQQDITVYQGGSVHLQEGKMGDVRHWAGRHHHFRRSSPWDPG